MQKIKVNLRDRGYEIRIQKGILGRFADMTRDLKNKKFVILSSAEIFKKYGGRIQTSLKRMKISPEVILIREGEQNKNEKTLFNILKRMAGLGIQRDWCLVVLGGGVIGDIGGFAASIYMRGINFVQVPTTLLAQVDASIGGKTAIDFVGIKNLVGTFYQPSLVLTDPEVLKSLDDRQYKTGLAEIVKYGVIQDAQMFRRIESNQRLIREKDGNFLSYLIGRSCEIKAKIVSLDEKESGKRAWLNYGHTLGHALESYFGYKTFTHGEAVAHGMVFAAGLSYRLGLCHQEVSERLHRLLSGIGLLRPLPRFNPEKILEKMSLDKKARDGQVQFVLTRKIGLVTIQKNIPNPLLLSALNHFQREVNNPH